MQAAVDIAWIALIIYSAVLCWLGYGFKKLKSSETETKPLYQHITIIICARNEEKHLEACLNSLLKQDYDLNKVQLILVNDASHDNTMAVAESVLRASGLNYTILTNRRQLGKKASMVNAMQQASYPLIISRDADTYAVSPDWLKTISACYTHYRPDMIIGPVGLGNNHGLLWALQAVENNILTVLAGGSAHYNLPFLCSGANLVFTKEAFEKTGGFKNHIHIASGDDVLFMQDLKKLQGSKIHFLKNSKALVNTYPQYSFSQLFGQKIRWASKFRWNSSFLNLALALLTFVVNAAWLFCLIYGFITPINNGGTFWFVVGKLLVDFLLLWLASGFIKNKWLLWYSIPVGFVYPLYACLVALASVFIKPKWKA